MQQKAKQTLINTQANAWLHKHWHKTTLMRITCVAVLCKHSMALIASYSHVPCGIMPSRALQMVEGLITNYNRHDESYQS